MSLGPTLVPVPWRRVLSWEVAFFLAYLPRFIPLEIWRASKNTEAEFSELKFGETPLKTIRRILSALPPISTQDIIYDLGCGRGRAAFLFHFLTGAKVRGVDVIPSFLDTAQKLANYCRCRNKLDFLYQDFRTLSLTDANLVYACALCFGADTRQALLLAFLEATPHAHLVSVGWRPHHARLQEVAHFSASFSWGSSSITINRLLQDPSYPINADKALPPAHGLPFK